MPVVALTDRFCATIKAAPERVDYTDEKTPGLMLRVSCKGVKSFAVLLVARGRRIRITLGQYPRVSLAQARGLALEAQSRARGGDDPRPTKSGTVGDLLPVYYAQHLRPNLRSAKAAEQRINRNIRDVIGSVPLAELHRRDINRAVTAGACPRGTCSGGSRIRGLPSLHPLVRRARRLGREPH